MEPITAAFGLACIAASGGAGFWLRKVDERLNGVNDTAVVLQQAQAAHFTHLNKEVGTLQGQVQQLTDLVTALRATNPEMHGAILAHEIITAFEEDVESDHTMTMHALSALETLVSNISTEATIGDEALLSSTSASLLGRLLSAFDSRSLSAQTLGLNPVAAHRLGHASLLLARFDWAEASFGLAYQSSPGNANILEALEHIALLKGDDEVRRHWLEARMTVHPDQPDLLRSHAHLLAKLGDAEAERDVLRLEALGVDTAADRSLLSGLRARAGSRSEALEAIEKALAEDPNQSADWLSYAQLLNEEGEDGKAHQAVERCLELDRQSGEAWGLLAQLLAPHNNRVKEALKAATHAVALDAGGTDLVFLKSNLQHATGSATAAQETLEKALLKDPANAELRARMAGQSLLEGDLESAQKLLDETPFGIDHALLHVVEGRLHLALGDLARDGTGKTDAVLLADALSSFEGALKLNRELGVAWLGLARTKRMLRDIGGASEDMDRAMRLLPDQDPSACAEAALLAIDKNDLSTASKHVDAASVHGDATTVSYVRGNIALGRGLLDKAIEHYSATLELNPNHIRARLNRCSALMASNQAKKSLDDAQILVDLAPSMMLARYLRAEALMGLCEWAQAREDLEHVLESAPHHHQALTQLAACFMSLERPERAENPLNEAIRLQPNHAPAWHQRGILYLEIGRNDNALNDFEAAIRCDESHFDSRLKIAAIHHQAERFDQAELAWHAVLGLEPEHSVARKRLAECETHLLKA
jgi:tetratricopeptide (TPR) repeat protein